MEKASGDSGLGSQNIRRQDHEQPLVISELGWRYHHLGIPTTAKMLDEKHIAACKMYVSGFDTSPFGVEWMRFEPDSPVSEIIKRIPHLAFEVDDLEEALVGKELIGEVTSPSNGVRVAMFLHNGAPIELLEFQRNRQLKNIDN
jgi:hypothetical protein